MKDQIAINELKNFLSETPKHGDDETTEELLFVP